jgi:parallel beta-helix repeat protein
LAFKIQPVKAEGGTIYIRADGSIDPPTAPIQRDRDVYTFTGNINDSIVVERSSIIIDGAGHTLQGPGSGSGYGFYLLSINNVTIINTNINGFIHGSVRLKMSSGNNISRNNIVSNSIGIYLYSSSYNTISGNNITNNGFGVSLSGSSHNTLHGNNIANNNQYGILLSGSSYNTFSGNKIANNRVYCAVWFESSSGNMLRNNSMFGNDNHFAVRGSTLSHFIHDIDTSNTVDGKPIYYWINRQNETVPSNAGYVALVNSTNITINGLEIKYKNYDGILLAYSKNSQITSNTITDNFHGIYFFSSSGNNLSGNIITNNWDWGVYLSSSSGNSLVSNNITNNRYGVWLDGSSNNNLLENRITAIEHHSIQFTGSSYNTLRNNILMNINGYNFGVYGATLPHFIHDIDTSNTVNGKPIYYWINRQNMEVPSDAGYVALINCTNITVKNLYLKDNGQGVLLASTKSSMIIQNTITYNSEGIYLWHSSGNTISGNNLTRPYPGPMRGIFLQGSSSNTLSGNNIANWHEGVTLDSSSNNSISSNNITNANTGINTYSYSNYNSISGNNIMDNANYGVTLWTSYNTVSGNKITNNRYGGVVLSGPFNTVHENYIANNGHGIYLSSSNNKFYNNDFINNTKQVYLSQSGFANVWDDGYPSGGNYWSNYFDVDLYSGPNQDQPGSDGIWDHPYVIDANNKDRYPLVNPWTPTPPPPENRPPNPPTLLWQAKVKLYDTEIWLTDLPVGGTIYEDTVALLGEVSDPDGDRVKMQVELRRLDEYDSSFIGIPTHESEFVDSDGGAFIIIYGLVPDSYHWQARTIDEYGLVSDWVDFGNNPISEADFKFVIPEIVFQPPYAIGIGGLGFADKSGTGRALYYSYVFPQDGYGTIGADTHVFPGGGYAWAEADFILGDSWTCTYSGEYEIAASIAIDGFMRVFYASAPKWGKGYAMAILKARLSIYDKTDGVEVLQEDLVIFEEKIEWSPLPIQIPRYKLQRYYSTPFSIAKYVYLQQGHEYEWNFRMHVGGYAIVALAGAGIAGGHITAYLNEVRIKPH